MPGTDPVRSCIFLPAWTKEQAIALRPTSPVHPLFFVPCAQPRDAVQEGIERLLMGRIFKRQNGVAIKVCRVPFLLDSRPSAAGAHMSHGHMLHSWWHTGICHTPGVKRAYATLLVSNGHMPHSWCHTRKTYMYADR